MTLSNDTLLVFLGIAVAGDIFLGIRVAVLRNYLHYFEEKLKEIETRLSTKKPKEPPLEQKQNQ